MNVPHLLLAAILAATLSTAACSASSDTSTEVLQCSDAASVDNADADQDGYSPCQGDCDDADPNANPGQAEESETDGYDQDCDNFNPTHE